MTELADVPQISLVIELAQPRRIEGITFPAEIASVRSNLPARYFDIRVVTPVDKTDEHGECIGSTTTYAASEDPHEFKAKYPFMVFDPRDDSPPRQGKDDEWVIMYRDDQTCAHCLVLGCDDITSAIARFRKEHPEGVIIAANQAELDQGNDHPMGYLDQYEEILVVGGARLQKGGPNNHAVDGRLD